MDDAAAKPPEQEGELNIEGLSTTPQGTLLIAFRNPTPEGERVQVLSDDGSEKINGKDCKDEEVEPEHKYFPSRWITPNQ